MTRQAWWGLMGWVGGVVLMSAGGVARGGEAVREGEKIVDVRIEGNRLVPAGRVLANIESRVGRPYSKEVLQEDVRRLDRMGLFYDVVASAQRVKDGVAVVFKVVERPVIQELSFQGNQALSEGTLRETAGLSVGQAQNVALVLEARRRLLDKYQEKGFPFAEVRVASGDRETDTAVRFEIIEGPRVRVARVDTAGNAFFTTAELKKQVQSGPPTLWFFGGYYNARTVESDIEALKRFYRNRGFLDVQVARELTFSEDRRRVTLTFVIQEGEPYTVEAVEFTGATGFTPTQLLDGLELQPAVGLRFDEEGMERDRQRLLNRYGQIGYVDARVTAERRFTAKPHQVAILYRITEGPQVRLRKVVIRGNKLTQDRVIRRQVLLDPGELIDTVKLKDSQQRLRELNLFKAQRFVPSEPAEAPGRPRRITEPEEAQREGKGYQEPMPKIEVVGDDPAWRDVLVEVEETDTGMIIFGAGVSSDSGLIGTISLTQRNFDIGRPPRTWDELWEGEAWRGAGQQFSLVLQPGTEESQYSINFFEPYLLDRDVSLGASASYFERDRDTWTEERLATKWRLGKRLAPAWYGTVGVTPQLVRVTDVDEQEAPADAFEAEGDNALLSFPMTLRYDVRDSIRFPTRGHMIEFGLEPYTGDWSFLVATARAQKHWLLSERPDGTQQHILTARGQAGYIFGDTPIFERFYAGGSTTFRGFEYRGVGPHDRGEPIGGDFLVLVTAEYSYPIVDRTFRGVLFVDMGTVEEDFEVTEWRSSVGFGFRLTLDVFGGIPMAFDFGFPVTKGDDDETQVFHFWVGATF